MNVWVLFDPRFHSFGRQSKLARHRLDENSSACEKASLASTFIPQMTVEMFVAMPFAAEYRKLAANPDGFGGAGDGGAGANGAVTRLTRGMAGAVGP